MLPTATKHLRIIFFVFILKSILIHNAFTNDMLDAANVKNGKEVAGICFACHSIKKNEPSKGSTSNRIYVGPNLFGVVGRNIASKKDFTYSPALKKKSNEIWTPENLSSFLKNPSRFAPSNMMNFTGVLDPQDRMDLIAFLITLK